MANRRKEDAKGALTARDVLAVVRGQGKMSEVIMANSHLSISEIGFGYLQALIARKVTSVTVPILEASMTDGLGVHIMNCGSRDLTILGTKLEYSTWRIKTAAMFDIEFEHFSGATSVDLTLAGDPVLIGGTSKEKGFQSLYVRLIEDPELSVERVREGATLVYLNFCVDGKWHSEVCWVSCPR
ncbi:MAG: hypothetical protein L6R28_13255 [Planctomycetes bacterium]|nr:hypothetical protein [Planctomycetota bacterium]